MGQGRHRRSVPRVSSTALMRLLARFGADRSGSSVIIYALTFTLVMFTAAVAIDYGRAEHERMQMQRALDAAALAAAHKLGLPDQDEKARVAAETFFRANSADGSNTHIDSMAFDAAKGEVRLTAAGRALTSLLNMFGISGIDIGTSAKVSKGDGTVEVALVLDNSGSMAGQSIADLKTAAKDLVSVIFAGGEDNEKVKVGVVPFAGSVNVGPDKRYSGWIDTDGASPIHFENFAEPRTRFDLFSAMNQSWRGCVEARPAPHDTQDTPPDATSPATLFVPTFTPDEPDPSNNGGSSYPSNYLDDFGGSCPAPQQVCINYNTRRQRCEQYGPQPISPVTAQARTCKYDNGLVSGAGPNSACTTTAVQELTTNRTTVENAIGLMQANGYTNIGEGLMWGWRLLSPEAPYTEGRPWSDKNNQKVIVLMTDGQNTYPYYNNHNKSMYGAFGYASKGRLGSTYSQSAYLSQMNSRTLSACANAKTQGVTVYTIAFRLESDPATLSLLQSCASGGDKAYRASDGQALIQVFQIIGREISQLRVSS